MSVLSAQRELDCKIYRSKYGFAAKTRSLTRSITPPQHRRNFQKHGRLPLTVPTIPACVRLQDRSAYTHANRQHSQHSCSASIHSLASLEPIY